MEVEPEWLGKLWRHDATGADDRLVATAAAVLGACGSDSGSGRATTAATTTSTVVATTASAAVTTTPMTPTTRASTTPTTVAEQQQAIWPAAGVVFTTPEAAAEDFVSKALGVPPVLGPYVPGDTRSGEIDVFSPGEGGNATRVLKSKVIDDWGFRYPGIEDVEHVCFYAATSAPPEVIQRYLDDAYRLGRDFGEPRATRATVATTTDDVTTDRQSG